MVILGISALYHDSAATVIKDGEIVAAAQEERFSRVKHDKRIPINAIRFCLKEANMSFDELDAVAYYDNPLLTVSRFCDNVATLGEQSDDLLNWSFDDLFNNKIWVKENILNEFGPMKKDAKFLICSHHLSHAASAFYPSPFEKAVIITNDGVGEWETSTLGIGEGNKVEIIKNIKYPHSLGLLYSAFTYFCGFKVNEGDYKFMGLAPYGDPIYYDLIKEKVIDVKKDGSYRLNLKYFDFQNGRTMISPEMEDLFGGKRRDPESRISKREMDIAASVQKVTEEIIINQARYAKQLYPDVNNIVLAGGCALNCVANGKLHAEKIFDNIWIQPAAGDAGGSLGCAMYAYYGFFGNKRVVDKSDSQKGTYLGIEFTNDQIEAYFKQIDAKYKYVSEDEICKVIADEIAGGKVVGHFNGRAEFGPRSLGNRSILADCRFTDMQSKLNLKIKYRESFRPFAPSVLLERSEDYFELRGESPYMLLVADVLESIRVPFSLKNQMEYTNMDMIPIVNEKRSEIPAVTHVDYSARIQTVSEEKNPRYYRLIKEYEKATGCGVIVNTSFNVRGEPIVNSPRDAYVCFMRTEMDVLVVGNYILYKEDQNEFVEDHDWREEYELD